MVELLSPAGDFERLEMAVAYGADAVYLAGTRFGMRAGAGNFEKDELYRAVRYCHERNVKVYITCNTIPHDSEFLDLPEYLHFLWEIQADALIVADLGVLWAIRREIPGMKTHISTQFGVVSSETACALYELGAETVVLARELKLDEIRKIRQQTPSELKLECFVHGAMCVAFSGRCLLSNYLTGRDSNRGLCAQPCRWKYHLVEETRPGEFFPVVEDNGTHIFNSRDLCMIDHIPDLLDAGVDSLKIEGRMKSFYYAAVVTGAYRHAIDAALSGKALDVKWQNEVNMVSHRPYTTGFYFTQPGEEYADSSYSSGAEVAGVVESCSDDGLAVLTQRNRISQGDALELLIPGRLPIPFSAGRITSEEGFEIESTRHAMMRYCLDLPVQAPRLSIIRKLKDY